MRLLASVCPQAEAAGVHVGQKLADARAICPTLAVHDADPGGDAEALARLARWCERYTPLAAPDEPDGLWLDLTGCAHLWAGGEQALVEDLIVRMARAGHACRAAVAGTPGAAWALARMPGGREPVLPPGQERAGLEGLPVAALRLEARTVAALRRVGLRTVGQMAQMPRGELSSRFGALPVLRLDQALGHVAEVIAWPHPPRPWEEWQAFAEPILTAEDLQRAMALLAERLCARLRAGESGGERFTAEFARVDGERPAITVGTAMPVRDPVYLLKLLAAKLDTLDPGFGVEVVRLSADQVAPLVGVQAGLMGGEEASRLPAIVDQVANRLGPARVWCTAPQDSHVPERAVVRTGPLTAPRWEGTLERPLRLMRRPEPIEVTAPVPDDPPLQFRWRGVLHRVRAATGPERIAREWWRAAEDDRPEPDRVRDYYRVEDSAGARFWMFRVGIGSPKWFLHGVFG